MHKLIAHVLIQKDNKYLVIKRSIVKRGQPNFLAEHWDIPGGSVELHECPQDAAIREALEEVNQHIIIKRIIHEDSNFDSQKQAVFTRLVYLAEITDNKWNDILLDSEEHSEYRFITNLTDLENEKIVPYLNHII